MDRSTHESTPGTGLVAQGDGWLLLREGEPFVIKGAGGVSRLKELASFGGNSIRTWDAEGIGPILDEAQEHGVAVTAGIWLEHGRHGHDYSDPELKRSQLERVERLVNQFKDHPAVLMWSAGNEVELGIEGDERMLRLAWQSVEDAAARIKELDPTRPVMAVIAEIGEGGWKAKAIAEHCPSVDVLGINAYGGAASIPDRYAQTGVDLPYVLTEFGPIGPWEGGHTPWGAPYEPSSAEKAEMYRRTLSANMPKAGQPSRCLGAYAFLWGNKQEATGTWFGMFLPSGESLPTVDAVSEIWTGESIENHAPVVRAIDAPAISQSITPGKAIEISVRASDREGDPLEASWELLREATDRKGGGDTEAKPGEVEGAVVSASGLGATLRVPSEPGAYRLFVVVRDGTGKAGTANLPFLVEAP